MQIWLSKILSLKIILIVILSQCYSINAQWIKQSPLPTGKEIRDACFISADTGWIFGVGGLVMQTSDGGMSWIDNSVDSNEDICVGLFLDSNHGWVAMSGQFQENDATIYGTTDGGNTWDLQFADILCGIQDLSFTDISTGWALAYYSQGYPTYQHGNIFLKTTDGGQNWQVFDTLDQASYQEIDFINDSVGFIAGTDMPNMMKTIDGGLTWHVSPHASNAGLTDVFFTDINNGYSCGNNLYFTHNGGQSWSSTICYHAYKVDMYDAQNGWTISIDKVYKVTNGGQNADYQFTPDKSLLTAVSAIDSSNAFVVGRNVSIYRTDDGGNNWLEMSNGTPNDLSSVFFLNENDGWAGGDIRTLLITHDGGEHWISRGMQGNYSVRDIQFTTADSGWLVNGGVWRTIDGGEGWQETSSSYPLLSDLFFINSRKGWSVGSDGILLKTTDGGVSWEELNSGTSYKLNSVFFTDLNTGWIAGEWIVKKTTDGGMSWEISYEANDEFSEVQFLNDSLGYLLGRSSCLKTTNGGESWLSVGPESACNFATMFFLDENIGFIAGCNDYFKTTNGGQSWERDSEVADLVTYANAICFSDENHGWIVGSDGVILHTETGGGVSINDPGDDALLPFKIFPNPSAGIVKISYQVESSADVEFGIYDLQGIKVFGKKETAGKPGSYSFEWDPGEVPAGIYLCKIGTRELIYTGKIVYLK